jgi:uncharacterized membrane protein YdjX (TVP38/TMEM64 family)
VPEVRNSPKLLKYLPLFILVGGLIAFFATGLHHYISFDQIREHRGTLLGWVKEYGIFAGVVFGALYAVMVAFSIPGGAIATLLAGFLFGLVAGSTIVIIGATLGAVGVFLAARSALGDALRRKTGNAVRKMEEGFKENALSYLLILRLIPIFPFWLVNLVPAFLGVPLRTYVVGTFFGIIPGSIVYASVGSGLGTLFDQGKTPDLGIIFIPEILFPILGLAILACLPIIYKKWRSRSGPPTSAENKSDST